MSAAIKIRVANPGEADAITALLQASYSVLLATHYDADLLARLLPLMARANDRLLASGTYYVAERGADLVGCGGWSHERPGTGEVVPGLAHIRHVAVHPGHARAGIGRALMDHCFRAARTDGVTRLECYSSLNAVDFYRAAGFEISGPIDAEIGAVKMPSVVLHREIQ